MELNKMTTQKKERENLLMEDWGYSRAEAKEYIQNVENPSYYKIKEVLKNE
jgi:hypothetical protein